MKFVTWFSQPERSAKVAGAVFNVTPLREGLALNRYTDNAAMTPERQDGVKQRQLRLAGSRSDAELFAVRLESGFQQTHRRTDRARRCSEAVAKSVDTAIAQGRYQAPNRPGPRGAFLASRAAGCSLFLVLFPGHAPHDPLRRNSRAQSCVPPSAWRSFRRGCLASSP